MTSGCWTRRRRQVFPSTRPPDRNRRYRHRAKQRLWLVSPPASAASAGHPVWSAAPWTRGFHLSLRGGAPATRTRPAWPRSPNSSSPRRPRIMGDFSLRTDLGVSPQLTGTSDFWHPTGGDEGLRHPDEELDGLVAGEPGDVSGPDDGVGSEQGKSASARRSRAAGGTSPGRPSSSALIQRPRLVRLRRGSSFLVRVSATGGAWCAARSRGRRPTLPWPGPGRRPWLRVRRALRLRAGPSVVTGNRTPGHRQPVELPPPIAQVPGVACPAGAEIAKVDHQIGECGTDMADHSVPVGLRLRGVRG